MPEKATVVNMKGEQRQVPLADIRLGELVLVHSGERVPIDGVVLRGDGTVDDSVLTGETMPMAVDKNTRVLAGSRYNGSLMLIRVISRYEGLRGSSDSPRTECSCRTQGSVGKQCAA